MARWSNWSGTVNYDQLEHTYHPETMDELRAAVRDAIQRKWRVRVVGQGHSWSNLGVPSHSRGAVICMTGMAPFRGKIQDLGNGQGIAEVGGGLTIKDMNNWLDKEGWALFNMGDANPQVVIGGISTETHGSGVKHASLSDSAGSLSENVEGVTLVGGDGNYHTLTNDQLPAGRLSLGKLGAIYSVQLKVRKRYFLTHDQKLVPFNQASEGPEIEKMMRDSSIRHFEYWHYPHTDQAEKIVRREIPSGQSAHLSTPLDHLLTKIVSGSFATIGALNPSGIPQLLKDAVTKPNLRKTFEVTGRQGPWNEILLGKSNVWRKVVKTYTMEYQLPYANLWPAFNDYVESIKVAVAKGVYAAAPTQIRFSQKSERSLLTHLSHDPTVSFSVSFFRDHRGVHTWLPELEQRFIKHGGKPHWAKMYYEVPKTDAAAAAAFEKVRHELDPEGTFSFDQGPYTPDPEAFQNY